MSNQNKWPCWSCQASVTMAGRADADGNCPRCGVELDILLWPFPDKPSKWPTEGKIAIHDSEPLHPHNDGLDEYRQPVHVGELDPAQRSALATGGK